MKANNWVSHFIKFYCNTIVQNRLPIDGYNNFIFYPRLLTKAECESLIQSSKGFLEKIFDSPEAKKRYLFESKEMANNLWDRIKQSYPHITVKDEFGDEWSVRGLNSMFRLASYDKGERDTPHEDGFYQPEYNKRSFASVLIYLNDVEEEQGGATRFFDFGFNIHPKQGNAVVFLVNSVFHDGEVLNYGSKYILRTDVMYECENPRHPKIMKEILELKQRAEKTDDEAEESKIWDKVFRLQNKMR